MSDDKPQEENTAQEAATDPSVAPRPGKAQPRKRKLGKTAAAPLPPPPPKSAAEEEIDAALESSVIGEKKRLARKKIFNRSLMAVGAVLLAWGVYYLFAPFKGTMAFGICKVFLELNERYPEDIHISQVIDLGESVRIWYSRMDAFGEYRMEAIQCYFKPDETMGYIVDKVTINRRDVDADIVARFNTSLPVIVENMPDLTIPYDFPDNIGALQFETDKYRKPIF